MILVVGVLLVLLGGVQLLELATLHPCACPARPPPSASPLNSSSYIAEQRLRAWGLPPPPPTAADTMLTNSLTPCACPPPPPPLQRLVRTWAPCLTSPASPRAAA